jgi:YHS domain-containing protein
MKKVFLAALYLGGLASSLLAKELVNVNSKGIGIRGYDPVAYFIDGKPEKGLPQFISSMNGVTYLFASAEHKSAFDANPSKYSPQYGGFCAYGVSKGSLVEIDPAAFQIVEGKLLLQYSKGILEKFNKDQAACLSKADANWIVLLEKKGK